VPTARGRPWKSQNEFFLETFVDELAHAREKIPFSTGAPYWKAIQICGFQRLGSRCSALSRPKLTGAATARRDWNGIAIGDSRRLSRKEYTICAAVATVSVSKKGEVR